MINKIERKMQRSQEVSDLLNNDINNYALLRKEEKENFNYVCLCLGNENFNPTLLPESVLNDEKVMVGATVLRSKHINIFKIKINKKSNAEKLAVYGHLVYEMLSDKLKNDENLLKSLLTIKPMLYKTYTNEFKEIKAIFKKYMDSRFVEWRELPEIYRTKANALKSIRMNIYNIEDVIEDFALLKNTCKLWEEISKSFQINYAELDTLDYGVLNNALEDTNEKLLKTLEELHIKEIFINKYFLIGLKRTTGFEKFLHGVDESNLNERDNYLSLLRENILKDQLLSVNPQKKEIAKIKMKI